MTKKEELEKMKLIEPLFLEANKIIDYIEAKKSRLPRIIDRELEAFYTFLQRIEQLPNTKDLQQMLKQKMTDLDALKGYNLSNGKIDGNDFVASGRRVEIKNPNGSQLIFTLFDYFPQPHKYRQWLINQNNKTLTKNDVLSLLLCIVKYMGLDTKKYQDKKSYKDFIEEEFNAHIAIKEPPYKTIITEDALLMLPIEAIDQSDRVYYVSRDGEINTPMNFGKIIIPLIENYLSGDCIINGNNLSILKEHHLTIYNLINT